MVVFDPNVMNFEKRKQKKSGGHRAQRYGALFESQIESTLKMFKLNYKTHVNICKTLFGTDQYTDFIVYGIPGFEDGLAIESKTQTSRGSADEKLYYFINNIKQQFPIPCIIVYSLDGVSQKKRDWLLKQKDGAKIIEIFKYDKFLIWLHKRLENDE